MISDQWLTYISSFFYLFQFLCNFFLETELRRKSSLSVFVWWCEHELVYEILKKYNFQQLLELYFYYFYYFKSFWILPFRINSLVFYPKLLATISLIPMCRCIIKPFKCSDVPWNANPMIPFDLQNHRLKYMLMAFSP